MRSRVFATGPALRIPALGPQPTNAHLDAHGEEFRRTDVRGASFFRTVRRS